MYTLGMAKRERPQMPVSPRMRRLVEALMAEGRYATREAAVLAAVREALERRQRLARLRSLVDEGLRSLERGEGIDDADVWSAFDRLDASGARRKRKSA
jgi:Arc/MetJ-type ribon-helix-helix transcriptional regulator